MIVFQLRIVFYECQILGNMKHSPPLLMLFTVIKNLQGIGYLFKVIFSDKSALSFSLITNSSRGCFFFLLN